MTESDREESRAFKDLGLSVEITTVGKVNCNFKLQQTLVCITECDNKSDHSIIN